MEVKNGIIIDGVLHEGLNRMIFSCKECSLYKNVCNPIVEERPCDILGCQVFINRGKVNIVFPAKCQPENGCIYRNGVKIEKEK
jgi:hypothetical protein